MYLLDLSRLLQQELGPPLGDAGWRKHEPPLE